MTPDGKVFQGINLSGKTVRDFEISSRLEWLEANGLGGYASSTVSGANTRRYHGLLVATLPHSSERRVLLSKFEEKLTVQGDLYELGCNQYPGVIYPSGHRLLESFRIDPFPTYRYSAGGVLLEKEIFAVRGANRTVITYRLISAPSEVEIEIRPMIAGRNFHHLHRENLSFNAYVHSVPDGIMMVPYDEGSRIYLVARGAWFRKAGYWYRNFEYVREMLRGLDFREDLFSPGYFLAKLRQGDEISIVASTDYPEGFDPAKARDEEIDRRRGIIENPLLAEKIERLEEIFPSSFIRSLLLASDTFLIERSAGCKGLIAGYHWFSEWGRDSMISLPGLLLALGRFQEAAELIRGWVGHMSKGLIPNFIPEDGNDPVYNSADATFWLFNAVYLYMSRTGDLELIREIYPILRESIEWHVKGTRYNIHVDPGDGLLVQGEPGVQLTWMDAKVGDWVVTPRYGKAVEINGLWYNALMATSYFAEQLKEETDRRRYREMAERVKGNFMRRFWNGERRCLFDCINEDKVDDSIRPNQVIAMSLPFTPVPLEAACAALEVVERELLTPYGLRTLSPQNSSYRERYQGDQISRDGAYHQGTVWPWLLGPFISAYARCHRHEKGLIERIIRFLEALPDHILQAGVGTISEIFDGDPPHHPRGCISQAWSVAEVLRVLIEEVAACAQG
ncbi:amylo-alpha-1,6-glucosidase [Candidatus Poribacteria bacterium]|nr:amylo-alpha-1,6-glucosidase [Candidatus Poribacteria bacterium]